MKPLTRFILPIVFTGMFIHLSAASNYKLLVDATNLLIDNVDTIESEQKANSLEIIQIKKDISDLLKKNDENIHRLEQQINSLKSSIQQEKKEVSTSSALPSRENDMVIKESTLNKHSKDLRSVVRTQQERLELFIERHATGEE